MDRLWGCRFAAAVFTNLMHEHMDYHKTFEEYFAAKRRLFEGTGAGAPECAGLNVDDPYGKHLVGRINVYNILAAIGAAQALDIAESAIAEGIAKLESVPGRFQRIEVGQPF